MEFRAVPVWGISDPVSCLTHLMGAIVFAVCAIPLLRRGRGHAARMAVLSIFAGSCVTLLAASGVYHAMPRGTIARDVLQRLDHAAIFAFIAGSYTPALSLLFRGWLRWGGLAIIWGAALAGIVVKTWFFTAVPEAVGLGLYLMLGWIGVVWGGQLWRMHGEAFIRPLLWGGVVYTVGAVCEFLRGPTLLPGVVGPHELIHLAVLAGIALHWQFALRVTATSSIHTARTRLHFANPLLDAG